MCTSSNNRCTTSNCTVRQLHRVQADLILHVRKIEMKPTVMILRTKQNEITMLYFIFFICFILYIYKNSRKKELFFEMQSTLKKWLSYYLSLTI